MQSILIVVMCIYYLEPCGLSLNLECDNEKDI